MILQHKKTCCLLLFLLAVSKWCLAQDQTISLSEAINIAKENYAGLERDRLNVAQYQQLANAGLRSLPSQIFISGEEFGATTQSGIHSLNLQQSFYSRKASSVQKSYYKKAAVVAKRQLDLTERELEWQVEKAYYSLQYAKQKRVLVMEHASLFSNFLSVATAQLEIGESGKIPQLAAQVGLGQAQLREEHAREQYNIAFTLFNQWLNSEDQFDIEGELTKGEVDALEHISSNNPSLQILEAQKDKAISAVEVEKSKLFPQINTGARLQNVNGDFPAFGYQVGVNIPLFKKSYKNRIEAAKVAVKMQEANLLAEQQNLTRVISELQFRLEHQEHILEYLNENLRPIVEERSEVNLKAYRKGEINYLEYLNSLEQVVSVKEQYLEALYEFKLLQIEINYWMGR